MKKNFIYLFFVSLFAVNAVYAFQISFTRQDFGFRGSSYGAVEFGDYDADGDLDLLVLGEEGFSSRVGMVYTNNEGVFSSESFVSLPYEFVGGDAKWGDYDNDGDLDILISGQTSSRLTTVLRNDDGTFSEQDFSLINVQNSAVEWGDYDNDGDLDAAVSGSDFNNNYRLIFYENRNDSLVFDSEVMGVRVGDLEFVDYDLDDDLDLFITGQGDDGRFTSMLDNNGGNFTESGITFVSMLESSSDFGDFDGDGDLDLLLSGNGSDSILTVIYRNEGSDFSRMLIPIQSIEQSDVKWADFDNDGDLDFIQSGRVSITSGIYLTEVYENTGSNFVRIEQDLTDSLRNSAISVADYDNDGDVDFALSGWDSNGDRFTVIYSNNTSTGNTIPVRPQNGGSTTAGDGSSVDLYWDAGSDNETQTAGLTYSIRIGTAAGASDILSAHITDEGKNMLGRRGNMESRRTWKSSNLAPGTYFWGVQTVDNSFAVSNFLSGSFTLSVSATFEELDPGMPAFNYGDMAWGDFDNDRDLDLAMYGMTDEGPLGKIFINNAGSMTESGHTFSGSPLSNINWGDYDNDGDMDLLTNTLYRNDFGSFNFVQEFTPSTSDLSFVDYDNDGDLDIHWVQTGQLFRNDGGIFTVDEDASQNIVSIGSGNAAWGDYDNDGDKDLVIAGGNYLGNLYRNDNGSFVDWGYDLYGTEDGTEFSTNGYQNADIEWADYDNDGDLDFIIIGEGRNQAVDVVRILAIYQNNGVDLNNEGQWLFEQTDPEGSRGPNSRMYDGVSNGALSWGDFDNDGWRDFILNGSVGTTINPGDYTTQLYKNNRSDGFFLDPATNASIRGMGSGASQSNSAIAVADYDNDGDLDFVQFGYSGSEGNGGLGDATRLYRNMLTEEAVNQPPGIPQGLTYSLHGDTVILSWEEASDDKSAALTYNVRVRQPGNSKDIVPANAFPDGKLKMVYRGNAEAATSFKLTGLQSNKEYIWTVQSIDAGYRSSPFAEEQTFSTFPPEVTIEYPNGGEEFAVDSVIFVDWQSTHISDFRLEYSTNNGTDWNVITIINETFGTSSEEWTIPDDVSNQCLIRVVDINNISIADISNSTFSIVSTVVSGINLLKPNGGEQWEAGRTENITWNSSDVANLKIEFSQNNGAGYTTLTGTIPAGNGTFAWTLPAFVSNSCLIRLSDVSNASVMDVSAASFSIIDTSGPVFDDEEGEIDYSEVVNVDYTDTVSVKVTDNTSVVEVRIYYREAGTFNNFQQRPMQPNEDEYEWIMDKAPQSGFQIFVQAEDGQGNITTTDTIGTLVNIADTFENPSENVGGSSVENYVLFSIPAHLNNTAPSQFLLVNNFDDTPDPQDYRFYSYQNGSTNNFIEYNNSGFGQIVPGKGFFLLSNDDFNMIAGEGRTVNPADIFEINGLEPGWNLVGNPFPYPIPFGNITAENTSGQKVNFSLWEFDGSWKPVESGELQPWKGYALDLSGQAVLKVPPYREALTKTTPVFTTLNNNDKEWMIRIKALNGRTKSAFNFAGQLSAASDAIDKYDLNGPPRIEKQVSLSFKNKENIHKVTDIRALNTDGHIWDFACYLDPMEENLTLSFSGIDFSADMDYFLIDLQTNISYDLKLKTDIDFAVKNLDQKSYKLAVGSKAYLESQSFAVELYPQQFDLKQNFPNPFNPSTQISFTISDAARVKLAVYDVLGQQVAVLVNDLLQPGNYNAVWDATGQSSGIYFIKLISAKNVAIRRAIFIK